MLLSSLVLAVALIFVILGLDSLVLDGSFSSTSSIVISSFLLVTFFHILSRVVIELEVPLVGMFVIVTFDRHVYVGAYVEFLLGKSSTVAYAKSTYAFTSNKNSVVVLYLVQWVLC